MILAGDIGGTKTLLAVFDGDGADLTRTAQAAYESQGHDTFGEILADFIAGHRDLDIDRVCFDVAGPVVDGEVRTTNLPWVLKDSELASEIGVEKLKLLNDLEATAYGMLFLAPDELVTLNPPAASKPEGNIAAIAAGTGLGEAYLYWDGERHNPIATEGGHSDFAPRTDEEVELLRYMRHQLGGRVSYERILSGPGLYDVFSFLRDTERYSVPEWLGAELAEGDPSPEISRFAIERSEPICVATINLFCELYGAEAGNMALRALTHGGVFVGGGIAPKNLEFMRNGSFLRGFFDKGRFSKFMQTTPVYVSLNDETALLGAAQYARRL